MITKIKKLWNKIKNYQNVVGMSSDYRNKIKDGKIIDKKVLRIYVTKKVPESDLPTNQIIPKKINGDETDIVEIGEIFVINMIPQTATDSEKTQRYRPVIPGTSMGNKDITTGTFTWSFVKDGVLVFASNAHVFSPDATLSPEEIQERRILQPGTYDGGTLDDIVAYYKWHKQLYQTDLVSECNVANAISFILNLLSDLFGRKTKIIPIIERKNHIDFAVAKPIVDAKLEFIEDIDLSKIEVIGLWFAGSNQTSIGCKIKYIEEEGYYPVVLKSNYNIHRDLKVGKSGRTTSFTKGEIFDPSAIVNVNFGLGKIIPFEDIFLTKTAIVQGGDSGSLAFSIRRL